jgi:hypothetical protein
MVHMSGLHREKGLYTEKCNLEDSGSHPLEGGAHISLRHGRAPKPSGRSPPAEPIRLRFADHASIDFDDE